MAQRCWRRTPNGRRRQDLERLEAPNVGSPEILRQKMAGSNDKPMSQYSRPASIVTGWAVSQRCQKQLDIGWPATVGDVNQSAAQ